MKFLGWMPRATALLSPFCAGCRAVGGGGGGRENISVESKGGRLTVIG